MSLNIHVLVLVRFISCTVIDVVIVISCRCYYHFCFYNALLFLDFRINLSACCHGYRKISNDLQQFEQTVRAQSSQPRPHVDLRLCRLCYKTKFVDGIGRMCHDCHKRVCNNCGSFTKYRRDVKKNRVGRVRAISS